MARSTEKQEIASALTAQERFASSQKSNHGCTSLRPCAFNVVWQFRREQEVYCQAQFVQKPHFASTSLLFQPFGWPSRNFYQERL